jgi:pimeloyl-ACP methyl ester carboxylesterase
MTQSPTSADEAAMSSWRQDFLQIDGLSVRYQVGGHGPSVLLLHGWGGRIESFTPVYNDLMRSYTVYAIDFPGFGDSSLPGVPWGSEDYARLTLAVMDRLEVVKPHVIAHSFGGQVIMNLAAAHPERLGKLVLVASAGLRGPRTLKARMKKCISRMGKWAATYGGSFGKVLRDALYQRIQSQDYSNAGLLRATLVRVVNEDLRELLPRIQAPTLLVWGEHDRDVPVSGAQIMARLIPDAQLVVFENAGHFPYLDQFDRFRLLVGRFLRDHDKQAESSPA